MVNGQGQVFIRNSGTNFWSTAFSYAIQQLGSDERPGRSIAGSLRLHYGESTEGYGTVVALHDKHGHQ